MKEHKALPDPKEFRVNKDFLDLRDPLVKPDLQAQLDLLEKMEMSQSYWPVQANL